MNRSKEDRMPLRMDQGKLAVQKALVALAVLLVAPCAMAAQSYRVVKIADGDTLTALSADLQQVKCRLYGIDAPEKKQAFGQASKLSLAQLSFGRTARIDIVGHDRYGRAICRVAVDGVDVNKEQIARGMAWMYRDYASDIAYSQAESGAQVRRIGIWQDARPVPPWDFRRKKSRKT
jgi:endonuclease YncB( thermonuclease family)